MKMATPLQAGQPLFTIEQIELIRRLRNSGITKDQLVGAFETLERIDRELGPIYTIPVSLATHPFTALGLHQMAPAMMQQVAVAANIQRQLSQATMLQQQQQQQGVMGDGRKRSHDDGSADVEMQLNGNHGGGNHLGSHGSTTHGGTTHSLSSSSGGGARTHLPPPMTQEEVDEIEESEDFKEFTVKGDILCCEEIRQFVAQYNIKQQQVATLSGISQSYVSRYLKGDFHDMSERSRKAIQRWYIAFRKNPAAVGPAANSIMLNSPSPVKKFISMEPGSGEFVNYPRRERFVFRPSHLEVLERSFMDDSYPSQEKREDIARICNATVEIPAGRTLGDRERVTAQIVSNWFANKRKEMKKLAREEGIPASQVPLRGRGRPSRFNMFDLQDMMSSGNGLSNGMNGIPQGMEMDMGMDMKLSPTSLTGSSPPSLQHPTMTMAQATGMAVPTVPSSSLPSSVAAQVAAAGMAAPPAEDDQGSDEDMSSATNSHSQTQQSQSPAQPQQQPKPPQQQPQPQPPQAHTQSRPHQHPEQGHHEMAEVAAAAVAEKHVARMNNGNGIDMSEADDHSLSLAVEMAAVNQAIIALSGQTPVPPTMQAVKPEREG